MSDRAKATFERFEKLTDLPLAVMALVIVPVLILEDKGDSAYVPRPRTR